MDEVEELSKRRAATCGVREETARRKRVAWDVLRDAMASYEVDGQSATRFMGLVARVLMLTAELTSRLTGVQLP